MAGRVSLAAVSRSGRHAAHVTAAAAAGFYPALYLLDRPVAGVYALFAPIALGVLSPVPGAGRGRAVTVLQALPFAAALVALGTVLAVTTWAAVAGMLVVGFALTFGIACGPRLAGTVPGLQLFYILACFPPYEPRTLPERLVGLAVGGALLALLEVLFPDAPQPSYRGRIADALDVAAGAAAGIVRDGRPDPAGAARLREVGGGLRFSQAPAGARPTGAGRADRALAQAGSATRRLLDQLAVLAEHAAVRSDQAAAELLRGVAADCARSAAALRRGRPCGGPELLEEMVAEFLAARGRAAGGRVPVPHGTLTRQSTVLTAAVSAVTVRTAAVLALGGRRTLYGLPREQFWYAASGTVRLWLVRVSGNLTRHSVVFQNALRTAVGLALARLVAGSLDLSHGFWVLLAVLTLGRTTAGATWSAVRLAAAGTLAGAFAAGLLIVGAGGATDVYAVLLVPMMLIAFTLGPLGGPAWAQGLFTLVVSTAFAQIAPVTWRLAEARLIDVLTGSAVGLLCGLIAWPAGARAEIRYSMAALLRSAAPVVRATTAAVTGGDGPAVRPETAPSADALRAPGGRSAETLHRLRIAEAAYAQYRTEPAASAPDRDHDWLAVLNYGARAMVGAYWLPRTDRMSEVPPAALRWAREATEDLADATVRAAAFPAGGVRVRPAPLPPAVAARVPAHLLPLLTDVEVWLRALAADLEAGAADHAVRRAGAPAPA
ncbi:FUSC family protein [Streptomyces sp. NPDC058425]|uniref:FUSC family protein n=2 Tax=unclassified Streptomyces TaxID=2593676 RepID=UPI00364F8021